MLLRINSDTVCRMLVGDKDVVGDRKVVSLTLSPFAQAALVAVLLKGVSSADRMVLFHLSRGVGHGQILCNSPLVRPPPCRKVDNFTFGIPVSIQLVYREDRRHR